MSGTGSDKNRPGFDCACVFDLSSAGFGSAKHTAMHDAAISKISFICKAIKTTIIVIRIRDWCLGNGFQSEVMQHYNMIYK